MPSAKKSQPASGAAAARTTPRKVVAKKVAAKKAVAKKAVARRSPTREQANVPADAPAETPAIAAFLDIDPAAQFDKLDPEPAKARTTRSAAAAGATEAEREVEAVLGQFFALRRDEPLTPALLVAAAQDLGVEVAALRAIAEVEARGEGFDARGRPKIVYERHVFARNTVPKNRFDAAHPDISARTGYGRGNYGTLSSQWVKLARAYPLDGDAALKACSWGTFQILGENHRACGFADVRSYVAEMFASPAGHLRALVGFIRASPPILRGLRNRDWEAVARGYNGPGFKEFSYDTKLAAAYTKHARA